MATTKTPDIELIEFAQALNRLFAASGLESQYYGSPGWERQRIATNDYCGALGRMREAGYAPHDPEVDAALDYVRSIGNMWGR